MTVATVLRERFDLGPVLWHGKRNEGGGRERGENGGGGGTNLFVGRNGSG